MKRAMVGVSALALCFGIAACGRKPVERQAEAPEGEAGNNATNAAAVNEAENATALPPEAQEAGNPKSILRPDVIPATPEPPPAEPVHAVIGFGASGLRLDEAGRAAIDALLAKPALALGGPIILRGHSDSRGSDGDNRVASRIRAERVRDYLVEKGIEKERIRIIALGETRPVAPNAHADGSDDPEGRASNRRVEIDVEIPETPAAPPDEKVKAGAAEKAG